MRAHTTILAPLATVVAMGFVGISTNPAVAAGPYCIIKSGSGVTVDLNDPNHDDPTNGDDVIIGTPGPDDIKGLGGDDVIFGNAGTDTISGGEGSDYICGGPGADSIKGGPDNDFLSGGTGNDVIDGGTHNQNLPFEFGDFVFYNDVTSPITAKLGGTAKVGSTETDTLVGLEAIYGGLGNDLLVGDGGANGFFGNDGKDTLKGGGGNDSFAGDDIANPFGDNPNFANGDVGNKGDVIKGGSGVDTVSYRSDHVDGVVVKLGVTGASGNESDGGPGKPHDTVTGVENVEGTDQNDTLVGDAGKNKLQGLGGDDTLDGGTGGADVLKGKDNDNDDTDTVSYATHTQGVIVDLAAGQDNEGDILDDINNVLGSPFNDRLLGVEGEPNVLDGKGGIDTADYSGYDGGVSLSLDDTDNDGDHAGTEGDNLLKIENLVGSPFNDAITGSAKPNVLKGGGGNDRLTGGAGADTFKGQSGDDALDAEDGAADVLISGGEGDDGAAIDEGLDPAPTSVEHNTIPS